MASEMEAFAGRLRVLELYSGIGGMHWALKESGVEYDVVQAMDVNTSANKIYQHNFPDVSISASSITKLTLNQLAKWAPNTILMSPPCQPFTRVGKKQDCQDPRTESFLHLLTLLRQLEDKPEYILVENVKGFEVSETRALLLDMLNDCNYSFQEFLLTPLQFGIPNCRMRYYLTAKLRPLEFAFVTSKQILETIPAEAMPWLLYTQAHQLLPDVTSAPRRSRNLETTGCLACSAAAKPAELSSPASRQNPTDTCLCGRREETDTCLCGRREETDICLCGSSREADRRSPESCGDSSSPKTCNAESCSCPSSALLHNEGATTTTDSDRPHVCNCEKSKSVNELGSAEKSCSGSSSGGGGGGNSNAAAHTSIQGGEVLTVAEAGRNMRHCEEEDVLVCGDGSRLARHLEAGGEGEGGRRPEEDFQRFLLTDKELRMFVVMDVVHPSFRKSSCFTKRYGHYVEGAGSLLMMTDDATIVKEASEFKSWAVEHKNRQQWGEAELSTLRRLKLRYFTPREVANLLCFPPQFEFPEDLNTVQCYRVLGNSLNVHVVSVLIRLLLMEPGVI